MLENKKLIYNEKIEQSIDELLDMDENNYIEMMINETNSEPSDAEVISSYSSNIEKIIADMKDFNDKMLIKINEHNISLRNKLKFINSIFGCKDKKAIFELVICFICDRDYLFNIKKIMRYEKSNKSLVKFINVKSKMDEFIRKYNLIEIFEKDYDELIKMILTNDDSIRGSEISHENKKFLKEVFIKYVKDDIYDEDIFEVNLEFINKYCTSSRERELVYPCLVFRIFTKYTKKLFTKELISVSKNILNYNEYKIDADNGKNFAANENYIRLFFELCTKFCSDDNLELNLYLFEKCSNLGIWYWSQNSANTEFSYTISSLLNSYSKKYDTFFEDMSVYYDNEFDIRGIEIHEDENKESTVITEDEYIDKLIDYTLAIAEADESDIQNITMTFGRKYLERFKRGRSYALKYVEEIKDSLIKDESDELKKDGLFNKHVNYNIELWLQMCADKCINNDIVDYLICCMK